MPESRPERILVLYGTHTGTSEEVAQTLCSIIQENVRSSDVDVQTRGPLALDDFLEDPQWEPLVIIVVSSYGLGHAPRNARQFRQLCDQWKDQSDGEKPLTGLQFALLGLGSSFYSTYQANPIAITEGLVAAGATLVGDRGSADSSAGTKPQQEQIKEWQDTLWEHLSKILETHTKKPLSSDRLLEMNKSTVLL